MPTRAEVREWAESYRRAWENADSEAVTLLFSEDASYRSNIYEEPHRGRSGVAAYWTGVTSTQSNATVRMGEPFMDEARVTIEFWTTMTIDDDPVTLAGCLLLEFDEDGLCSDLREYFEFTGGTQQPPSGWGR